VVRRRGVFADGVEVVDAFLGLPVPRAAPSPQSESENSDSELEGPETSELENEDSEPPEE
jgi:hypothetical protein